MTTNEELKELIDNPEKPTLYDWVYSVETFLEKENKDWAEARELIKNIKQFANEFNGVEKLTSWLKQYYKKYYECIVLPPITKRNQIFIAMKFHEETNVYYEKAYKPIIQQLNYSVMRIDEKQFNGSIMEEIKDEISNSTALIADLTGNCGGVYYEAGIAKGLQLCNHPIKLILTCKKDFFDKEKVHFDVSGDNIILYESIEDLQNKLQIRLNTVMGGENNV